MFQYPDNFEMTDLQINKSLVVAMIDNAVRSSANRFAAGDEHRTIASIRIGDPDVCEYFLVNLTHEISRTIGEIDKTIKAIYTYQAVDMQVLTNDLPIRYSNSINLVVWVDRKSAALDTLVASLEYDIQEHQKKLGCLISNQHLINLNVMPIQDKDVIFNSGFGIIPNSEYIRTKRIWRRAVQYGTNSTLLQNQPSKPVLEVNLPDYFDPHLIPVDRLLDHAESIEKIPPEDRGYLEPHLTELKVILIRRIISDQLSYIEIAKNWFTVSDLRNILERRIGNGKIGGKSAGMLLAARIINEMASLEVQQSIIIPESYFLGSDLIYIFMAMNGLMHWNDQKYKSEKQIWDEYPTIQAEFQEGELPPEIDAELRGILRKIGRKPIIVRSSSQLEDNFGTSFAGKYDSFFCPNHGSLEENLADLSSGIKATYASTLNPDALLYRRSKGLQDYDERMAVLIQVVQGEKYGKYFFPQGAGVAYSRNLYRWSPQIRKEDGFVRLVWGLGTRAVQRTGDDYPRLVALGYPTLHPDDSAEAIRRYSQKYIDLIDLDENKFKTIRIHDVLKTDYPVLRLIAQLEQDGYFVSPRMRVSEGELQKLAITYHELLRRTNFGQIFSQILKLLETQYMSSVDIEFTISIPKPNELKPTIQISLLQCRPQSYIVSEEDIPSTNNIAEEKIILSTNFMVPQGYLNNIRYIIYVSPSRYFGIASQAERMEIGKLISQMNNRLAELSRASEKSFVCVGPGRWGSLNLDLGVYVTYADIDHAGALIEISGKGIGPAPEPSFGTHFFQDLMEASIYPLAINLDNDKVIYQTKFFEDSPSKTQDFFPEIDQSLSDTVKLIDIEEIYPDNHLELIMNNEEGKAIAYLAQNQG